MTGEKAKAGSVTGREASQDKFVVVVVRLCGKSYIREDRKGDKEEIGNSYRKECVVLLLCRRFLSLSAQLLFAGDSCGVGEEDTFLF